MTKDEELELLRHENAALREENATLREELGQVQEHLQRLQERLGKDSHNSSLPPSSDRFVRRGKSLRNKSGKQPGGQKGHHGHHLLQVASADEVVEHRVERCAHCACDVRTQAACVPERRQVFELPAKRLWVVEHRVEEKGCPQCGKLTRAPFPTTVRAPAQYGAGMAALAVYLVQGQFVPSARAAQVMHDLLGVQMSAGSIAHFVRQCHQPLEEVEASLPRVAQRGCKKAKIAHAPSKWKALSRKKKPLEIEKLDMIL